MSTAKIVAQEVQLHDRDRYVACLFSKRDIRDRLLALYAMNSQLQRIAEHVTEPQLGEIRLQWWRDSLSQVSEGQKTGHPVVDQIGECFEWSAEFQRYTTEMIDARSFDVSGIQMPDHRALRTYLLKTEGSLLRLAAMSLDNSQEVKPAIIEAAAELYGYTKLMVNLPFHSARGLVFLPQDLCAQFNLAPDQLQMGRMSDELLALLEFLRKECEKLLRFVGDELDTADTSVIDMYLPLALVPSYLEALERKGADMFQHPVGINPLKRLWRIWRMAQSGSL